MNEAQEILLRYCKQRGYLNVEPLTDSVVSAVDANGKLKNLTINVYGDIMDNDTKRIIADANVPHTLRTIYQTPTAWIDRQTKKSIRKSLDEKKPVSLQRKREKQIRKKLRGDDAR